MLHFLIFFLVLLGKPLLAAPPTDIPDELWGAFTQQGQIPVAYWYFNDSSSEPKTVSSDILDLFIQTIRGREWNYFGEVDTFVYQALDDLQAEIRGKEVCLMGSMISWYEAVLLAYKARPVVLEYHPLVTQDTRVTYLTRQQFWQRPRKFDLVVSVSNTDHEGLGRYGEPLDPDGDLKAMNRFKKILNPGGKLLLAVPVGPDALVWNAYRVYGWKRLKRLLREWKPIKYYGFKRENLSREAGYHYQPVFLLTPK
jgi:SAM-dependent methyltransferase